MYRKNVNALNVFKISLVGFFVLMYVLPLGLAPVQTTPIVSAASSQFVALTPDVVSVSPVKPTIEVTQSQYQQQEAAAQAVTPKKAVVRKAVTLSVVVPEPSVQAKRELAQRAAASFGIDWKVLEAVWQIESGKTWQTNRTSSAGALGPCQFLPSTWRSYAMDGNGDGVKDITSAQDCLYGSAKLLASNGAASGDVTNALLHYNHSMAYVTQVLKIANSI